MVLSEVVFSANYLPAPASSSFSAGAQHRLLVLVTVGFTEPEESFLESLAKNLNLTSAVTSGVEEVEEQLRRYGVKSVPWKVAYDDGDSANSIGTPLEINMETTSTPEEMLAEGIRANNDLNDFCQAAKCFATLLTMPTATSAQQSNSLFNMASLLHMHNYMSLCLTYLEKLLLMEGESGDMTAHALLWSITQGLQTDRTNDSKLLHDQVVSIYSRLAENGDVLATHKYRTLVGHDVVLNGDTNVQVKGNPAYASLIFDNMATVFEKRLVKDLQYDCPWRMKRIFDDLILSTSKKETVSSLVLPLPATLGKWRVLDVGCGSGLVGRLFTELVGLPTQSTEAILTQDANFDELTPCKRTLSEFASGPCMIGVDIAEKMTRLAYANGGYSITLCDDLDNVLHHFFDGTESKKKKDSNQQLKLLDMIVAADTFLYVGPLEETFSLASRALVAGGLFMFSTEDLETSPMRQPQSTDNPVNSSQNEKHVPSSQRGVELLSSARYAHSQLYIETLAAEYNFNVISVHDLVIRKERSILLPGKIFVLQNRV